jgi:prepilin-type N-terminal cleavage/methylation domain-containing protein
MNKKYFSGFTLIELLVTISIIAVLSAILYASFNDARMLARDKTRMASLKEMQLSIEFYKSQYGRYPAGCIVDRFSGPGPAGSTGHNSCPNYITGHSAGNSFVPDFISALPNDPKSENEPGQGFYYRTDNDGNSYKLMILDSVESNLVTSSGDEFARCPGTPCGGLLTNTYAVYSSGAQTW